MGTKLLFQGGTKSYFKVGQALFQSGAEAVILKWVNCLFESWAVTSKWGKMLLQNGTVFSKWRNYFKEEHNMQSYDQEKSKT